MLPEVDNILCRWGALFNNSPTARDAFRISIGVACQYVSNSIRWYISFEVLKFIYLHWEALARFFQEYQITHKSVAVAELLRLFDNGM